MNFLAVPPAREPIISSRNYGPEILKTNSLADTDIETKRFSKIDIDIKGDSGKPGSVVSCYRRVTNYKGAALWLLENLGRANPIIANKFHDIENK